MMRNYAFCLIFSAQAKTSMTDISNYLVAGFLFHDQSSLFKERFNDVALFPKSGIFFHQTRIMNSCRPGSEVKLCEFYSPKDSALI